MQVVWRQFSGEMGNITAVLLVVTNILRDVYTKNYEHRSIFDGVICKMEKTTFLWLTVYVELVLCISCIG